MNLGIKIVKHAMSNAIWSAYSLATPATPSDFAMMFASGVHICSASSGVNAKSSIPGRAATIALVVSSNIFNWDESTLPAAFFLATVFFFVPVPGGRPRFFFVFSSWSLPGTSTISILGCFSPCLALAVPLPPAPPLLEVPALEFPALVPPADPLTPSGF